MTEGLLETFEVPVRSVTLQYGCDECRHNGTECANNCKVHPMTTAMLLLQGRRCCPFTKMTLEEIRESLKEDKK
ncbi:MAG: hypothetical protein K2N88_02625 [Muribaculaceae bacterium]|nr:hypothetical protein [Muribaculaceae bacterium]